MLDVIAITVHAIAVAVAIIAVIACRCGSFPYRLVTMTILGMSVVGVLCAAVVGGVPYTIFTAATLCAALYGARDLTF